MAEQCGTFGRILFVAQPHHGRLLRRATRKGGSGSHGDGQGRCEAGFANLRLSGKDGEVPLREETLDESVGFDSGDGVRQQRRWVEGPDEVLFIALLLCQPFLFQPRFLVQVVDRDLGA